MTPHEQHRRTDATIEFQQKLDARMNQLYPHVTNRNDAAFQQYSSRRLHHISFGPKKDQLTREILKTAFERASQEESPATYSAHGAQHQVYQESLKMMSDSVGRNRFNFGFQTRIVEIAVGSSQISSPIQRFVVESPKYERNVHRPKPYIFSQGLPNSDKARAKSLRKAALEYGMPFSILSGFYLGYDVNRICDILGDRNFRNNLPKGTKTLHMSHYEDREMLAILDGVLIDKTTGSRHPIRSSDSYSSAINIMGQYGWSESIKDPDAYNFEVTQERPFARTVFSGAIEAAQQVADSQYQDPARTDYIYRNYENVSTTRLVTSFLVFE